jgi:hypothetical protein
MRDLCWRGGHILGVSNEDTEMARQFCAWVTLEAVLAWTPSARAG